MDDLNVMRLSRKKHVTRYEGGEPSMIIAANQDSEWDNPWERRTKFLFLCLLYAANAHNFPESPMT